MPCPCCVPPVGACCEGTTNFDASLCTQKTAAECSAANGIWLGAGVPCRRVSDDAQNCLIARQTCSYCCFGGTWPQTINLSINVQVSNLLVFGDYTTGFPFPTCTRHVSFVGAKTLTASVTLTNTMGPTSCPSWSFSGCSDTLFGDFGSLGVTLKHSSPFNTRNCSYNLSVSGDYFTCVSFGNLDAPCSKGRVIYGSFSEDSIIVAGGGFCNLTGVSFSRVSSYESRDSDSYSSNGQCFVYTGQISGCDINNSTTGVPPITSYTVSVTATVV
jgi:hypothetical protein